MYPASNFGFFDSPATQNCTGITDSPIVTFDPRCRIWYDGYNIERKASFMSDPYLSRSLNQMISCAASNFRDASNNKIGTIGIDLNLDIL